MSFSKIQANNKKLTFQLRCFRCSKADKSVRKVGNMEWCAKCRKIVAEMNSKPNDSPEQQHVTKQRYMPDDDPEKEPETVLVNNVDRVLVSAVNRGMTASKKQKAA